MGDCCVGEVEESERGNEIARHFRSDRLSDLEESSESILVLIKVSNINDLPRPSYTHRAAASPSAGPNGSNIASQIPKL